MLSGNLGNNGSSNVCAISRNDDLNRYIFPPSRRSGISQSSEQQLISTATHLDNNSSFANHSSSAHIDCASLDLISSNQTLISLLNKPITRPKCLARPT